MYALKQGRFCKWIARCAQKPRQFLRMRCATHIIVHFVCQFGLVIVTRKQYCGNGQTDRRIDGRPEPKHVRPETAGKAKHASLPRLQNLPTTVRPAGRPLRNNAAFNLVTVKHISKSPFLFYPSSEGSRGELGVASGMFRTVTINW
jgi:hypothetical protein